MQHLIVRIRGVSLSRALVLLVLFCVFCLSSCAAAEESTSTPEHRRDAGAEGSDTASQSGEESSLSVVTPIDVPAPFDIVTAPLLDARPSNDQFSSVSTTIDVEPSQLDALPLDIFVSPIDASGSLGMDAGYVTVDVPRVSTPDMLVPDAGHALPDAPSPPLDILVAADVSSPPDIAATDVPPPRAVEICNGRDDDGNGFVDEIFECSVGRRGSTCITTCGANGYQLCNATCRWDPICQTYPEDCHDTIDNDCNGRIDCADTACTSDPSCRPPPPPPPPVDAGTVSLDAGRTDGCHDLVVRLQGARLPTCMSGWVAILYDSDGHPHESAPGGALAFTICTRLRGALFLSARCAGDYLVDWPGPVNHPANEGGVASITLDGNELADTEALLCLDRFSPTPGVRPTIPLESYFYGRCP